jgi:hypothetical protein
MEDQYENIKISKRFTEPHIFIAFYKRLDPLYVQTFTPEWLAYEKKGKNYVDQLDRYSLGKYTFENLNWSSDKLLESTLLVGSGEDFPETVPGIYELRDYRGRVIFKIVESSGQELVSSK